MHFAHHRERIPNTTDDTSMIDPRHNQKRRMVMAEIQRRGLNIIQMGKAWRVYGVGVDILTTDLAHMDPDNLRPYQQRKGK